MAHELKPILLVNIKDTLLHYLEIPNIHGYRWPSLLSQLDFCQPSQTTKVYTGSVGPVNSINKDENDARLLPTTISTYPVD